CGCARGGKAGRAPRPAIPFHLRRRCRGAAILVRAGAAADEGPVPLGLAHRQGHGAGAGAARRPRRYRADGVGGAALRLDQRAQAFRAVCRRRAQRPRRAGSGGGKAVQRRALTDATSRRRHAGRRRSAHVPRRASPESHWTRRYFARGLGECGLPVTHREIRAPFRVPLRVSPCARRNAVIGLPQQARILVWSGDTKLAEFVSIYGIWLVAAFIALESVGIPLPAEAALIAAG